MITRLLAPLVLLLTLSTPAAADAPRVALDTSLGRIVLELAPDRAPATVENFLEYVEDDFYDGTLFHRVIEGFMIQGGGFTEEFAKKETRAAIRNEADSGLENRTGTVAMARTSDPHSATAQFFINVADNDFLDHKAKTRRGWGYAAFGRVVDGMDVVRRIASVETTSRGPFQDVPAEPVLIRSASIVEE